MIGLTMVLEQSEESLAILSRCPLNRTVIPAAHRAVWLLLHPRPGTLAHRPLDRLDRLAHAISGTERAEHLDQCRKV